MGEWVQVVLGHKPKPNAVGINNEMKVKPKIQSPTPEQLPNDKSSPESTPQERKIMMHKYRNKSESETVKDSQSKTEQELVRTRSPTSESKKEPPKTTKSEEEEPAHKYPTGTLASEAKSDPLIQENKEASPPLLAPGKNSLSFSEPETPLAKSRHTDSGPSLRDPFIPDDGAESFTPPNSASSNHNDNR